MPRPTHLIGLFGLLLAAGCSSSSAGGTTDAGTSQDTGIVDSCAKIDSSFCGQPCDPGNEFGVGHFCNGITDCYGLKAALCATLGNPGAHFCTMHCQLVPDSGIEPDSGPTTNCGQGATCTCQSDQCGCTPNTCM